MSSRELDLTSEGKSTTHTIVLLILSCFLVAIIIKRRRSFLPSPHPAHH
jgi:hypothetical protein